MIAKQDLFLTEDRLQVVLEGDPEAQFLLVRGGHEIASALVEKYELASLVRETYPDDHTLRETNDLFSAADSVQPENSLTLSGSGFAKLRSLIKGQFGIRLQSTGEAANVGLTRIIFQTLSASPEIPYLVNFDQIILDLFTGPGQFDIVERDSSDVDVFDAEGVKISGGESEVTIATKDGLTDGVTLNGWSHLVKAITADKTYSVVFVPGTAGDGIYSISARRLGLDLKG